VTAVIEFPLTTTTFVAAEPPRETDAPEVKPLPEIEIDVPPLLVPEVGVIPLTTGGDAGNT
jgi:hypothetical protein